MPEDRALRALRNSRYYQSRKGNLQHKQTERRFIGVDGEGGGTDAVGRQNFLLLRAGELELFHDNAPLTTRACLDLLLRTPRDAILVGYYFTYDATQILRDLPTERLINPLGTGIFDPKERGAAGRSTYTWWGQYAIEFVPRQYFRVALLDQDKCTVIPGTSRTVNEVGGFFQKPFVKALQEWGIGDKATIDYIAEQKDRRDSFKELSDVERHYCHLECDMLAQLMERLREVCHEADIEPRQWRGAGWLSARLHEKHDTPKRKDRVRAKLLDATAIRAYYGGRFEVTTIGRVEGTVYEYDINSAYPASMLMLPCPIHTRWKKFYLCPPRTGSIFVCRVSFTHSRNTTLANLPIRRKGRLFWPIEGEGVYWSREIEAAISAGTIIKEWKGGYYAEQNCSCSSHAWVSQLYDYRKSLGKSTKGYPIKLGINGLYGKYAQRQGAAPWRDYIAAGLITAMARSKLILAYKRDPKAILYLATDALYSRRPLDLDIGSGLGQWEEKQRNGMFIVQPGIYWSNDSAEQPKTRGIPQARIIEHRADFEASWRSYMERTAPAPPFVPVPVKTFVGHRLALSWGRPEAAGSWMVLGEKEGGRKVSFDWREKRAQEGALRQDQAMVTLPRRGGPDYISQPYNPELLTEIEQEGMLEEAMDDFTPWGNSGE